MGKSMKDVIMKVTFDTRQNQLSDLEETLNYLKKLPIEVGFGHADTQSGLNIDFKGRFVSIYPEKISANYRGFEEIKDCILMYEKSYMNVINRALVNVANCLFYTKPKED